MHHFIDRRLNPKDKNLGNRQRFMRRARAQIKKVVNDSIKNRKISNADEGETISIPTKGIAEPRFVLSPERRLPRAGVHRQQAVQLRRQDPEADPGRWRRRRRQAGRGSGRGRRRLHLRAQPRGVPRHLFRGPRAARPGEEGPEGDQVLPVQARRLQPVRHAEPDLGAAHDPQQLRPPHRARAAEARKGRGHRGRDRGDRGRGTAVRTPVPPARRLARRARPADAAAQGHPLSRPDRHPLQAARADAEAEHARRSCSA